VVVAKGELLLWLCFDVNVVTSLFVLLKETLIVCTLI